MDKIKDFFHNFSDIFLAIAVASVMFFVLSSNLGSWFDTSSNTVLADEPVHIIENNDKEQVDLEDKEELNTEDTNAAENSMEEIEDNQGDDNIDSNENEVESDNTIVNPEIKAINIPNGTPGSGVARILKENGLIDDTQEFIKIAENLNLALRLKSGSFEIPTNVTMEDMVRIIAGQKI